jgi:hypothetical protein
MTHAYEHHDHHDDHEYQMARRARHMGAAARGGGGGGNASYFAEWRQQVNRELEESARLHQAAAVTFERLKGLLDDHDRRIKALESEPGDLRTTFGTYGGCLGQFFTAALSTLALLIALGGLLVQHWR